MHHAVIDAADAVELIELLEYFLERLDILADHDLAKYLFADCSPSRRSSGRHRPAHQPAPGSPIDLLPGHRSIELFTGWTGFPYSTRTR